MERAILYTALLVSDHTLALEVMSQQAHNNLCVPECWESVAVAADHVFTFPKDQNSNPLFLPPQ